MRSKDSGEPQSSVPGEAKPGAATDQVAFLNPRDPIEVASSGGGGVNDPSGTDRRPPGAAVQTEKGGTSLSGRKPGVRAKRAKAKKEGHEAQRSPRHSP